MQSYIVLGGFSVGGIAGSVGADCCKFAVSSSFTYSSSTVESSLIGCSVALFVSFCSFSCTLGTLCISFLFTSGLGAKIIGTEGRTLSANEPSCVGDPLRFPSDGKGGCSTTHTCCFPWGGGEVILVPVFDSVLGLLSTPLNTEVTQN